MNRREFHTAAIAALTAAAGGTPLFADEPTQIPLPNDPPSIGNWNLLTKTFGGKQFWADQWFFHGWRIQRNTVTGHHRLLDEKNTRHAWGSFGQCKTKLDAIRREKRLPPMRGKAVVTLHGLIRSRASMSKMATFLREKGKYSVFNVSYPSTRLSIAEQATSLALVIESLEGITEINFVCHSLGNLVVRHWLGDVAAGAKKTDKRVHRMVMLGPPNHQPTLATIAAWADFTQLIGGKGLVQLAEDWSKLEPNLATPGFEFGILAGGKSDNKGYNPLIPGDDDLVVSVKSTMLAGARDFRVLPVKHTFMKDDKAVQEYTLRFLRKGWFESKKNQVILV